jgi:hypothetical protein
MMKIPFLVLIAVVGLPLQSLAQKVGPEFQVNTYTTSFQDDPSVASDATGNFVVAWVSGDSQDGDKHGIFGQRYDSSGNALGGEFQVNTHTAGDQIRPSVASDAAGNFVVVWESEGHNGSRVVGQRYDSSGNALDGEFQVSTYTAVGQYGPSVASDAAGNFIVTWSGGNHRNEIFGRRYDSGGNTLGGEFQVNTYTARGQGSPAVASDATGDFVVVWESFYQDGDRSGIFGQRYDSSGNPLGGEFQVNEYTTSSQGRPAVASDAAGNFIVTWRGAGPNDDTDSVFGQRYDRDGLRLGGQFKVNTYPNDRDVAHSVASDANGNFVVVWDSYNQDGSGSGVFGRRYDSGGNPLGGEFQVNTYTTSGQFQPWVASDVNGNFVVGWSSYRQDSHDDIFGQRFAAAPTLSISDASVSEGDVASSTGVAQVSFRITLSAASAEQVMVEYATADGTATAPSDYLASSGAVTFEPGDTSKTVNVIVKGDIRVEEDETFFVNLSNPTNAKVADGQGVGTILNDDP